MPIRLSRYRNQVASSVLQAQPDEPWFRYATILCWEESPMEEASTASFHLKPPLQAGEEPSRNQRHTQSRDSAKNTRGERLPCVPPADARTQDSSNRKPSRALRPRQGTF